HHLYRCLFFFTAPPTSEISTLSLHDALPICQVIGFFHGYSNLQDYHPVTRRLLPDEHYRIFEERDLSGLRNSRGIVIGTARANPDRKSTRLNSSHRTISYAVFCLKKKKNQNT